MTGQILLALDGDLATAEPKTCTTDTAHRGPAGPRRYLRIQATWPWAEAITAAWQRIDSLPQDSYQPGAVPAIQEGETRGPWNPGHWASVMPGSVKSCQKRGPAPTGTKRSTPVKIKVRL
jgi:hypothetical protein